jgi:tRNA(fMet)-specific endonuclease VapC
LIHLDTNVVIGLLSGRPAFLRARFDAAFADDAQIAISCIVYHELMFGAAASQYRERNEKAVSSLLMRGIEVLNFDTGDAHSAGIIRADLKAMGTPIGPYDVLIAAQALRRDATLVTANRREFQRVPGLKIEDWTA